MKEWQQNMIKEFDKLLVKGDVIGHDGFPPWYVYDGKLMFYQIYCNGHANEFEISPKFYDNIDLELYEDFSFYRYSRNKNIFDPNYVQYIEKPNFELKEYKLSNNELKKIIKILEEK